MTHPGLWMRSGAQDFRTCGTADGPGMDEIRLPGPENRPGVVRSSPGPYRRPSGRTDPAARALRTSEYRRSTSCDRLHIKFQYYMSKRYFCDLGPVIRRRPTPERSAWFRGNDRRSIRPRDVRGRDRPGDRDIRPCPSSVSCVGLLHSCRLRHPFIRTRSGTARRERHGPVEPSG